MDQDARDVAHAMTEASDEERISFPEVVRALAGVGVERYHADLPAGTKTYYMPDGRSEAVSCHAVSRIGEAFDAAGVQGAVHAVQRGEIGYRTFCERIGEAGCVGYFVSLAGRRAVYYGRTIDTHVEWFPGAGP